MTGARRDKARVESGKPRFISPRAPRRSGSARSTAWEGEVARWYDVQVGEKGGYFQRDLVFPGVIRLLNLKAGENLLDVACGQGAFCQQVQRLGVRVTGVDSSQKLIESARRKSGKQVRYLLGDARHLENALANEAGKFDAVTCVLAVQNIDPLAPLFEGFSKLLRKGGRIVIAMVHPCFRVPRQSGWGWDEERKLQFRRVDRYLSPLEVPIQIHPGSAPQVTAWTFHRPLYAYVESMARVGLLIDAVEEWPSPKASQPGPTAKAENRAREEIPLFMAIRAVKISG